TKCLSRPVFLLGLRLRSRNIVFTCFAFCAYPSRRRRVRHSLPFRRRQNIHDGGHLEVGDDPTVTPGLNSASRDKEAYKTVWGLRGCSSCRVRALSFFL